MEWVQNYDPLGQPMLSSLLAAVPSFVLLGLLLVGMSAVRAAAAGLTTAVVVSLAAFKMPFSAVAMAACYGGCFGLMPIGWIILSAVFFFQLTIRSGQFDIVKRWVTTISPDRRMQALLIAFCFGTLLEGVAGFGAPVAISAAPADRRGFPAILCSSTDPVGQHGTGCLRLARHTHYRARRRFRHRQNGAVQMAGRQLPLFAVLIPAWMVGIMSGWKGIKACWPAILVCGGSYGLLQFLIANNRGLMVVGIVSGFGSLGAMVVFMRFWRPKDVLAIPRRTCNFARLVQ